MYIGFPEILDFNNLTPSKSDRNDSAYHNGITFDDLLYVIRAMEEKIGVDGSGDASSLDYRINALEAAETSSPVSGDYEPVISAGTAAQYWRGDKTWQPLNQAAVTGLTTADSPTFTSVKTSQAGAGTHLTIERTGASASTMTIDNTGNLITADYNGTGYTWEISNTEYLRLTSTGLGIGVAPSYRLDVYRSMTDTSAGAKIMANFKPVLAPASASSSEFRSLNLENYVDTAFDISSAYGVYAFNRFMGSAGITNILGGVNGVGFFGSTSTSFTTIANAIGGMFYGVNHFTNNPTGTITTAYSILAKNQVRGGAGITITNSRGVGIETQTLGTNNINLLIGTAASGNWSIYNNSTYDNYFAGNVGIGLSPSYRLHISAVANSTYCSAMSLASNVNGATTLIASFVSTAVTADAGYSRSAITADATDNPASASNRDLHALFGVVRTQIGGSQNHGTLFGLRFTAQHRGTGTVTALNGIFAYTYQDSAGTVTDARSVYTYPWQANASAVWTRWTGLELGTASVTGTITTLRGIAMSDYTAGTNNTLFGIGTLTTGNWALYINSTKDNYFAGKIGIGVTPTAYIHLASNQAGHIRMDGYAGNPSSVTAGDHWYNTSQKSHRFASTVGIQGLVGLVYCSTSVAGAITGTGETNSAHTFTLPANSMTAGKSLRLRSHGYMTISSSAQTITFRLKLGSTTVATAIVNPTGGLSGVYFIIDAGFTQKTAGVTGGINAYLRVTFSGDNALRQQTTSTVTIDTTASQVACISIQNSSGFESLTFEQTTMEILD